MEVKFTANKTTSSYFISVNDFVIGVLDNVGHGWFVLAYEDNKNFLKYVWDKLQYNPGDYNFSQGIAIIKVPKENVLIGFGVN